MQFQGLMFKISEGYGYKGLSESFKLLSLDKASLQLYTIAHTNQQNWNTIALDEPNKKYQ